MSIVTQTVKGSGYINHNLWFRTVRQSVFFYLNGVVRNDWIIVPCEFPNKENSFIFCIFKGIWFYLMGCPQWNKTVEHERGHCYFRSYTLFFCYYRNMICATCLNDFNKGSCFSIKMKITSLDSKFRRCFFDAIFDKLHFSNLKYYNSAWLSWTLFMESS